MLMTQDPVLLVWDLQRGAQDLSFPKGSSQGVPPAQPGKKMKARFIKKLITSLTIKELGASLFS